MCIVRVPTIVLRYAAGLMDDALCQGQDLQSNRALQALVAGLKAYSTWENLVCLQDCRECTGGMVSECVRVSLYTLNTHTYTQILMSCGVKCKHPELSKNNLH